uniref:WAP domain-containing protein n=1 Tax=Megaselia scalaris TaxID=36166 RepID=T1GXN5_MEGSC
MCEYLRDFSERMEGTEAGMQLAITPPKCNEDGSYQARQCFLKKIKVTRAEQRKILEENTIRKMRALLTRPKRDVESLKLYRVDDSALNIQVAAPSMGRNAKVIDMGANRQQGLGELFPFETKKSASANKKKNDNELSRGFNVTTESCINLKDSLDCLDLTCRMGCEYGFTLDSDTKCPACQCRDPCDGVTCGEGTECRVVDVSCEDEYCPPVPACLPRKPGQCPFLVPPGSDNESNTCDYECRTDFHCDGSKRCCSNGCGTQCVEPQLKTACQHLQTIQLHQSSEMGIPARQMYIAQCDEVSGKWKEVQCG